MSIHILYFAWARERIGHGEETLDLDGPASVRAIMRMLAEKSAAHEALFADPARLRAAINQQFADFDALVADGDELAFFPPVTGGESSPCSG